MEVTGQNPVDRDVFLGALPPIWPDDTLRQRIAQHNERTGRCVAVLDDDPTGCQTVHDAWVLTHWEVPDLRSVLSQHESLFFLLTNTRSMSLPEAQVLNRAAGTNLALAAQAEGRPLMVVSRSDSTLRGHFPGEVEALADAVACVQGTRFYGTCIIPFFPEGGRLTIGDVHWVQEGGMLIPAAQTAYARDLIFGYRHSALPDWVEEKTSGRVPAAEVVTVSLETLRCGGPDQVTRQLESCPPDAVVVVNAAHYRDLEVFMVGLLAAEEAGKHFLFRTAASFVKVAAGLPDRPLLAASEIVSNRPSCGGLIVFGSHVPKSTAQLRAARALKGVRAVELPVRQVLEEATREAAVAGAAEVLNTALGAGSDGMVYTSREVVIGESHEATLRMGQLVSSALVEVVRKVDREPRYVIAKGGITASDVATDGLEARAARILGQVLPGVPVWRLGPASRWPGLPYVVFPGNVGDDGAVADVVCKLQAQA